MTVKYLSTLIVLLLITISTFASDDLTVYELRCNHTINPVGIDDFHPSLSWKIKSSKRNTSQLAYQIMVSLSEREIDKGEVWNSGKVTSSQSANVLYAGKPLEYGKRYYWKVKVWDNQGNESNYSPVNFWELTLDQQTWKAEWISAPVVFDFQKLNGHRYAMIRGEKNDFLEPLPILRKKFSLTKPVKRARVYISGLGFHELYINGKKVGDEVLSPSFTNYDKTVLYNIHDVADFLRNGNNAIGVMLGNGWYNSTSKEVWGFDKAPWRNYPTVKLQMEITYDDNSKENVITDHSWVATTGPIVFSAVRQGEHYDARLEKAGWSEPDLDESRWHPVRKVAGPLGTLRPHTMPQTKVMKTFEPVSVKKLNNGNVVYDFGQNMAGFVNIVVAGKAGSRVQLKYAEKVNKEGAADQSGIDNLLSDSLFQIDRYTLKGEGEERWSPRFVYHGFRYVEVSFFGDQPNIKNITASAIHTSFEEHGTFSSSNELINKIQSSTLWAYKSNFVGFPTDCPQREKNGWTGDAQLACETGLSNFNAATSYKKWLQDIKDEQQADGNLPGIIPTAGWGYYWGNGPAWDIACVVIPWSVYVYTGDKKVLEENYDVMKKYVDFMHRRSPELITDFGLGDWIPVETQTPVAVTSTGYFFYGTTTLSKIAGILGKNQDQQHYSDLSSKIREAYNRKFFNSKGNTYANGSQTALSCALFHGLVPEKAKADVHKNLVTAVHKRDNHIDCGVLGARYIQHALTDNGSAGLAYTLVANKTYPGWGYWIEQGATTLWEDWTGETSRNHIMFGDVSSWFYKAIAGIRPDEQKPGFQHFIIRPEIVGDLTYAKATYESNYGTIVSQWKIEGGELIHNIEVPVNSTATYYVQAAKITDVQLDGKLVTSSGLKTSSGKGINMIELASGKYEFRIRLSK